MFISLLVQRNEPKKRLTARGNCFAPVVPATSCSFFLRRLEKRNSVASLLIAACGTGSIYFFMFISLLVQRNEPKKGLAARGNCFAPVVPATSCSFFLRRLEKRNSVASLLIAACGIGSTYFFETILRNGYEVPKVCRNKDLKNNYDKSPIARALEVYARASAILLTASFKLFFEAMGF